MDAALALRPDYVEALTNRGAVLHALNRDEEALVAWIGPSRWSRTTSRRSLLAV